ncbi:MAG: glycosyltransferase [Actinomycetales bacterium]|nr:glycosyltransferase [Actinomycetales bacterium]
MRAALARDDGSTLPLVLGFGALALVLVLVVAAASSLYLERKRLFTLADGAALVGAESFGLDDVENVDGRLIPRLDPAEVDAAVAAYVAGQPVGEHRALAVDVATTPDGRSARVTVSADWSPPALEGFLPAVLRVDATATARAVFR